MVFTFVAVFLQTLDDYEVGVGLFLAGESDVHLKILHDLTDGFAPPSDQTTVNSAVYLHSNFNLLFLKDIKKRRHFYITYLPFMIEV